MRTNVLPKRKGELYANFCFCALTVRVWPRLEPLPPLGSFPESCSIWMNRKESRRKSDHCLVNSNCYVTVLMTYSLYDSRKMLV